MQHDFAKEAFIAFLRNHELLVLLKDLEDGVITFEKMKARSKEDWKSQLGIVGIDAYNCLNPSCRFSTGDILFMNMPRVRFMILNETRSNNLNEIPRFTLKIWPNFKKKVLRCVTELPKAIEIERFSFYNYSRCSRLGIATDLRRQIDIIFEKLKQFPEYNFLSENLRATESDYGHLSSVWWWRAESTSVIKCCIETHTPWELDCNCIIEQYNSDYDEWIKDTSATKGFAMRAVEEIYSHMYYHRHRYGCITTVDKTWFFRRMEDSSCPSGFCLEISPAITCDSRRITSMMAFAYVFLKIERSSNWRWRREVVPLPPSIQENRYTPVNLNGLLHWELDEVIRVDGKMRYVTGKFGNEIKATFKFYDVNKFPELLPKFNNEVAIYKKLEVLQGRIIPRFVACGTFGYLLNVIVAEDVNFRKSEVHFPSRESEMDRAMSEIFALGVVGNFEQRNFVFDSTGRMQVVDFEDFQIA